ncbi:uncharacterized protein F4822DRAFT_397427 [Hypoxylon trugodes]|uniref:uncharacterized protein n=1 Tax=Hypoxylon trugodes TaxID=326681 RepID=UPI00219476A0|nr:uncharacterized protein F4822DRAFT_397427 [Hypoxylon trugodes]KAI1391671.1 hypothetical protein F4822DRAFT_397427 [Hypoxylon trugodes]
MLSSSPLSGHVSTFEIKTELSNLACALPEQKPQALDRGHATSNVKRFENPTSYAKNSQKETSRLGFIFTGRCSGWLTIGKDLLERFPIAVQQVKYLDGVLRDRHDPPTWSLYGELKYLRNFLCIYLLTVWVANRRTQQNTES